MRRERAITTGLMAPGLAGRALLRAGSSAQAAGDLGEEAEGLGIGIVAAPRLEAGAAEVDVGADLLGDLLGCADQVPGSPRLDWLAPERP